MNTFQTEAARKALIKELPLRSPSARFDKKVLFALGFAPRPKALPWLLWLEEAGVSLAVCWVAVVGFGLGALVVLKADALVSLALNPGQVFSQSVFFALKLCHAAVSVAAVTNALLGVAVSILCNARIFVNLLAGSILAGVSITALASKSRQAFN